MKTNILHKKNYLYESALIMPVIGYLDFITGHEICFSLFYLIPIILVTLGGSYIRGLIFSIIATVLWIATDESSGMTYSRHSILYWNAVTKFAFYAIISFSIYHCQNFLQKEKEISKFKSDMISSISHEFNNLLSGINLSSALLEEEEGDNIAENRLNLYKIHHHNYSAMKRQIRVFLNNSKLESGKIKLDIKKVKIRNVINNAINHMLPISYEKNIAIKKHFPKDITLVKCDIDLISLAISNLIANAIKYSQKNNHICVSIKRINDDEVEISVEDNGIGIDKEDFDKIFTGYYRTKESEKLAKGFGIGLKLAKDIIKLHNSNLKIESVKNRGSKFYFTLPLHH